MGQNQRREPQHGGGWARAHLAVHPAELAFLHGQVPGRLQEVRAEEALLGGLALVSAVPGPRARPSEQRVNTRVWGGGRQTGQVNRPRQRPFLGSQASFFNTGAKT